MYDERWPRHRGPERPNGHHRTATASNWLVKETAPVKVDFRRTGTIHVVARANHLIHHKLNGQVTGRRDRPTRKSKSSAA